MSTFTEYKQGYNNLDKEEWSKSAAASCLRNHHNQQTRMSEQQFTDPESNQLPFVHIINSSRSWKCWLCPVIVIEHK